MSSRRAFFKKSSQRVGVIHERCACATKEGEESGDRNPTTHKEKKTPACKTNKGEPFIQSFLASFFRFQRSVHKIYLTHSKRARGHPAGRADVSCLFFLFLLACFLPPLVVWVDRGGVWLFFSLSTPLTVGRGVDATPC